MPAFQRQKILPLFYQREETVKELAIRAGVSNSAAWRAVNGKPATALTIGKLARALELGNPLPYLADDDGDAAVATN